MSTQLEHKNKLIAFSYIRLSCNEINKKHNVLLTIPNVIISIIIEYFKAVFEWDPEKCSDGFIILNDDSTKTETKTHGNQVILAKHAISLDECSVANWEITVRDFPGAHSKKVYKHGNYICMAMGYVEYQQDMSKSIRSYNGSWIGGGVYQCSMTIEAHPHFFKFAKYHWAV